MNKKSFTKRVMALALSIIMVLGLMPMTALASDTPTEKNITLGASHIEGAQASNVYFGTYQQSSDGNGGYNIDPIKWRVLSNADGKLFLLSDQNLDVFEYHKEYESVTWETSTMRSWLNGLANNKGDGENAIDYTNDNFLDTAFSASEQVVIADTTVVNKDNPSYNTDGGNNTTDKVFLLSLEEVYNTTYGFTDNKNSTDTRKATNTAYVADGGKTGTSGIYAMEGVGEADSWWLRSSGSSSENLNAVYVYVNGLIDDVGDPVMIFCKAVRPAFNLDTSSVLFTSAAKGGKADGFNATIAYEGTDWKLTLLDTSRSNFTAKILKTSARTLISYSGATTGENEYISAMVKDANGNVTYYGRIKNVAEASDASGYVEIDLSGKMNSGDKLYIFNEQYNGDYMTDYASELKEITVPSEINAYNVSFDANDGDGTMSELLLTSSNYTLPECTFTAPSGGKQFKGWATSADGSVITDTTITLTADTTLYAVWENIPAEVPIVQISENLTLTYGEFTNQKITATVEEKDGYTYAYQWIDNNKVISNTNTLMIPDDLAAGEYDYHLSVGAKRNDNGQIAWYRNGNILVKVNAKELNSNSSNVSLSKTEFTYNGKEQKPRLP